MCICSASLYACYVISARCTHRTEKKENLGQTRKLRHTTTHIVCFCVCVCIGCCINEMKACVGELNVSMNFLIDRWDSHFILLVLGSRLSVYVLNSTSSAAASIYLCTFDMICSLSLSLSLSNQVTNYLSI